MSNEIVKAYYDKLGGFPEAYICFDMETTGCDVEDDLIVEMGCCLVGYDEEPFYESYILDWTRYPDYVPTRWLTHKLDTCRHNMQEAGKSYHISIDRVVAEGQDPKDVLEYFVDLFTHARQSNKKIVGHNIIGFDNERFAFATKEWLGEEWKFKPNEVVDTAVIEKALLVGLTPFEDEEILDFSQRVLGTPVWGAYYNLESHCVNKYKLLDKYPLDMAQSHSAGFDAMLTHLLLEEFRNLATS